ncbi:kinesin-like protein KIF28P [Leptotrombidium deliense]|uniref:Kinesin-like protein 6 n=1 Tax=Leptotrombidium deliense TaxID=299467 RepID=A0A443STJ7_9ACAR|nr:kinesin-like protein KIF28P [Leptotrombidium deliense]
MENETSALFNPNNMRDEPKKFTFDYSYWSHDGFTENDTLCLPDPQHFNGKKYADQERVYNDLGKDILHDAFDGYNAALFAYGQTGSGKSFTVIGYGANKGIVPRLCEELFETIEHRRNGGDSSTIEVQISMLEIYNEIVRDLFNPETLKEMKKGLKVREHPTNGFFAENLKYFLVTSQKEILTKIEEGTTNRSIASTNMNETSSRAHTIVGISISQKTRNANGLETSKTSNVHLVDLAGSERLSGTMARGERLKEGVSINQSLSCLGNCIHALAEKTNNKNIRVPYRDSVLTRLLMNALGGNSKTIMIAAISPADINYDETLSTLRYADRAKQIKTHATVNEDPTDSIIRQLKDENDKLKRMIDSGEGNISLTNVNVHSFSEKDIKGMQEKWEEEMKAVMVENERRMAEMKQTYEEKLHMRSNEEKFVSESRMDKEKEKFEEELRTNPYLSNLNFDEQLSGKIVHIIKFGANKIGKSRESDIVLYGPSIHEQHATIHRQEKGVVILERQADDCRVLLNGDPVTSRVHLNHNDRLLFGSTQLFVYNHPSQRSKSKMTFSEVTFELAQEEIASKAGFDVNNDDQSLEAALLNKDLLEVLPGIEVANAIAEELDKNVRFEIMLVSPQYLAKNNERTEVFVKVYSDETEQEFEWSKEKFLNRLYVMKEMYQNYEQGQEDWDLPEERDPFLEDASAETRIGSVQVYLQPLAFMVELKEQLELLDYKGKDVGIINIEIVPCSHNGREFAELDDIFVDSPSELIGKDMHFVIKINNCRGLPSRFTDIFCTYQIFLDEETRTEVISETSNPDFNHKKMFSFTPATQQLIDYLKDEPLLIQVFGKQTGKRSQSKQSGRVTKQMMQEELLNKTNNLMQGFRMNGRDVDPNKQSIIVELLLMKKQQARQHQKLENVRKLITASEKSNRRDVSVKLLKELMSTSAPEQADDLIAQVSSGIHPFYLSQ